MRFDSRSFSSLPCWPSDQRVLGELEIVHHAPTGMSVYAIDPGASSGSFHLRYEGAAGATPSNDPQLLAVNLVRSDGSPARTRHFLADMMLQPKVPSVEDYFVASGRQVFPSTSTRAVRDSWCLQIHLASAFARGVQRNVHES